MRISDWSSDVCSSDLIITSGLDRLCHARGRRGLASEPVDADRQLKPPTFSLDDCRDRRGCHTRCALRRETHDDRGGERHYRSKLLEPRGDPRSEEHTSELQSLMRISYAVFSLKKKQQN